MPYVTELKDPIIYWQYKNSPKFKLLMDNIIALYKKYYPCEIWELLDIDTAEGYALDIIGQRLGYPRPEEVPEAVGRYDISYYAQAYYDMSLDQLDLVHDDTYRYMLKIRIAMWQPWHGISITSFYKALAYAFPEVDFYLRPRQGQKIMDLYILSYIDYPQRRTLFSDVMKAPLGQTLLIHDVYETMSFIVEAPDSDVMLSDGAGNQIMVAPLPLEDTNA